MNVILKVFFSLSLSGSVLILALLFCKPFLKDKISRQWQYYIWLLAVARLLLPFTPEISFTGELFRWMDAMYGRTVFFLPEGHEAGRYAPEEESGGGLRKETAADGGDAAREGEGMQKGSFEQEESGMLRQERLPEPQEAQGLASAASVCLNKAGQNIVGHLWLIWLAGAAVLLLRKIMLYRKFSGYVRAGYEAVEDTVLLDDLAQASARMGVKRPVGLYVNKMAASPLLLGFFRPCIILPNADLPEGEFRYTVKHELLHYKRRDMFYKWLVQIAVCLHWYNPLVYRMEREINRACELSCDEAVIRTLDTKERRVYGDTLLHAMRAGGNGRNAPASVMLNEGAQLLKERLGAIMVYKKMTKKRVYLSLLFTAVFACGFVFSGAYAMGAGQGAAEDAFGKRAEAEVKTMELDTVEIKGKLYYLIFNAEQLKSIGMGEEGLDKDYLQQADIDISGKDWVPIGTMDAPFTGSYNGNGFEIRGWAGLDADSAKLFGVVENAHIYNLIISDYGTGETGSNAAETAALPVYGVSLGDTRLYDIIWNGNKDKEETREEKYWEEKNRPEETEAAKELAVKACGEDNVAKFAAICPFLDEECMEDFLYIFYEEDRISFFSAGVGQLEEDSSLPGYFAEKAYGDDRVSFFSVLTDWMGEKDLMDWCDRAFQDGRMDFLSVLLDAAGLEEEYDALEEQLERQQIEEYQTYGIAKEDEGFYYKGQLVRIFLDAHAGKAYSLDVNPKGMADICIVRDGSDEITGVRYMTEQEREGLFGE